MKYAFLRGKIQKPEGDEGTNNGGGAPRASAFAPTRQPLPGEANSDESDDGGVGSDDADSYRDYHQLGRDGTGRKSVFGEALKKIQGEDEDEEETDDKEDDTSEEEDTKEEDAKPHADKEEADDQKEVAKDDSDLDDETKQLLNTDIAELKGKNGAPISKKAGEFIKTMKAKLAELSKAPKQDPQLTEKLTQTESELQKLRSIIDNELFEKSDSFKQTFLAPIEEGILELQSYFEGASDDDAPEITKIFNDAVAIASAGTKKDRVRFLKQAEKLIDYMDAGPAVQNRFLNEVSDLFDKIQTKEEAFKKKSEDRKQFVADRMEQERSKKVGSTERALDTYVRQFTAKKQAVIDNLPEKERKEYLSLYEPKAAAVKKSLASFIVTGEVNAELATVLQKGVTAEAIEHEANLAWRAYADTQNKLKIMEDENKALRQKVAKITGEPVKDRSRSASTSSRYDSSDDAMKRRPNESVLAYSARKNGISVG